MATPPAPARERMRKTVPALIDYTEKLIFGDVWERPGLGKRDRSLVTIAALVSRYRPEQLEVHIGRALDNGVTAEELAETHHPPGLLRRLARGHDGGQRAHQGARGAAGLTAAGRAGRDGGGPNRLGLAQAGGRTSRHATR